MAVSPERTIRPSTPEDRPQIAGLLDRLLTKIPLERRIQLWEWRAHENPAAPRDPDDGGRVPEFLVVEEEGRLVGVHGLFPLRVKVGRETVVAATSCDFAVDPEAPNAGMPLKLRAMSRDIAPLSLSTSANEAAHRITAALGGIEVPWARTKFLKPLRASGLLLRQLESRSGGRGSPIWKAGARVAGPPADAALRWGRAAKRRLRSSDVRVEVVEDFGERFQEGFDRLWADLGPEMTVAVVRDADYLRWRYGAYPFPGVEMLAATRGGDPLGLAVVHHHTDSWGLRCTVLLDLFGLDRATEEALLTGAARLADQQVAHYMEARAGAGGLRDLLEDRGFLPREADHGPYNVKSNAPELDDLLAEPDNWSISQGDGDICFFVEG